MFAHKLHPRASGKTETWRSPGTRVLLLSARLFPGDNSVSTAALLPQGSGSEFTCPQHPSVGKAWLFLIPKKMWCVPRRNILQWKYFISSKVWWLKLTRHFLSIGGQCVNEEQPNTHYRSFSPWPNALETLQVIFWAPQHLVSMNCLSCRREEVWSPNPCCKLQDSQIWLASCMCRWDHGALGAPVQHSRSTWELQTLRICLAFCWS